LHLLFKVRIDTSLNMNKYERLINDLQATGTGTMKCFGNSMTPILNSGSLLTFESQADYEVGDIVFAKVRGRFIDAHKITQKCPKRGYLISNNKGYDNGWTMKIFGKALKAEYQGKEKSL